MRKVIAVAVLSLMGAALVLAAGGTYSGAVSFCFNAVSCNFSLSPGGGLDLRATATLPGPNMGDNNTFTSSSGSWVVLPGDHGWNKNISYSGTITNAGPGIPAYYFTLYHVVGTFSGPDTSSNTTISGEVNNVVECHASACRPFSGGATASN